MTATRVGQTARVFLCAAMLMGILGAVNAQPAADGSASARNSVKLTNVVVALPVGTQYLNATKAIFCVTPYFIRTASGNREKQDLAPYVAAFTPALESAGYQVVTSDNLFGQEDTGASDYQVAAVITDMRVKACVYAESAFGITVGDAYGDSAMTIDWQVYSPLKKEVVARITTSATAKLEKRESGGMQRLITEAFAANARALAADAGFRTAVNAARPAANNILSSGKQDLVTLSGSLKAPKRSVADAVGSVVTLTTGSGSGSGVLVSDDGYMLTNAHVVGGEKEIRARWSDGIETVAQVIRVAKDRDIALVKTNPRERSPLPIKRGAVTQGQRVFAIGSPRGKDFQGTVSSGVISASRILDGLRYIQSDVSVSPGSSGGALLDETGSLIGITVLRVDNDGPAGLNFFIPISDAMDFLSLEAH